MIRAYARFAAEHRRTLLFGAIVLGLSGFGQTYLVALFGASFREEFALSDGEFGTLYAAATLGAALTLPWVGPSIDRVSLRGFLAAAAALLSGACALLAISPSALVLAVGLYGVRLAGQGLMVHTAITATAAAHPGDAGKALSLVGLGSHATQALLPILVVSAMAGIGWRWTWAIGAGVVLAGAAAAVLLLPASTQLGRAGAARPGWVAGDARIWRDPRLLLTLPALLAVSFLLTGFLFHQARLASEQGWPLGWLAGWFVAFAGTQGVVSLLAGPFIDRFGAVRLASLFLLPQGLGLLLLFLSSSPWVAPAYLVLTAVSAAIDATLAVALWVELFGFAHVVGIRSRFEAGRVFLTGAAPVAMGGLLDRGIPLTHQALGGALFVLAASALAAGALRADRVR